MPAARNSKSIPGKSPKPAPDSAQPAPKRETAARRDAPSAVGIAGYLGRKVVLDTEGPMMYLGTLQEVLPEGYWLEDADIRDRNEGHVSKESYACEAKLNGIRANRRRIFVTAKVVISASALEDVIVEFPEDE